jgi:hypothetical protein
VRHSPDQADPGDHQVRASPSSPCQEAAVRTSGSLHQTWADRVERDQLPGEVNDIAGLGRRARLDAGTLGVIVITVNSAMRAVELLGGGGVMALAADEVVLDADQPEIPVGIDGETVMMPTPVRCAIQPRALRVRVPRDRPGVRPPKPRMDVSALRTLASLRSAPAGAEHQEIPT